MTETRERRATDQRLEATAAWLEGEFPGWEVEVATTATWRQDDQPLWIARKDGHHPQAELSAAKLHTRLTEYLERRTRRVAETN